MTMLFRSTRTRLTLWYIGILALILVAFAAVVYLTMRATLNESLDDSIANRAFLTQELITLGGDGLPELGLSEDRSDPDLDDYFQRVFDAAGELRFDNSARVGDVPVDRAAVDRALAGRRGSGTVGEGENESRVLTLPIVRDGGVVGALQVGESTADVRESLRTLLFVTLLGLPAALVVAAVGGYWLSSRALSPIDKITRAAREISEHDLSRRLALDLPDDEVGRLARTFDGMIARLEAAFQRQRQFTADASHELRTPLTAIRGQIDVALQRDRDAAAYREVLATVNEQVDRMTRLVGGLLMLARGDARAFQIERAPVDIPALVASVAAQARPLASQKGLTLDTEGTGAVTVSGDEDLLLQLTLNLIDNAIKYTEHGGITIAWRASDDVVEISVRDTGPGIAEADRERIFERFYRVDGARERAQGGAGLGLAICRWIAEAHGGGLTVATSPQGSTFTTTLPRT